MPHAEQASSQDDKEPVKTLEHALSEEQLYAAAGLFTIALREVLAGCYDTNAEGNSEGPSAMCAKGIWEENGGQVERVYSRMGIPRRAWEGLKQGVSEEQKPAFMEMLGTDGANEALWVLLQASIDATQRGKAPTGASHIYDARIRTALGRFGKWFGQEKALGGLELALAQALQSGTSWDQAEGKGRKDQTTAKPWWKSQRNWAIGATALGGGAAVAFTGGLALPAIAAGVQAVAGATAGGVIAANVGLFAGAMGAFGGGMAGYRVKRLTGDVKHFEMAPVSDDQRDDPNKLAARIFACGWAWEMEDFKRPWEPCTGLPWTEDVALIFEPDHFMKLGHSLEKAIKDAVVHKAVAAGLAQTVLRNLMMAVALPAGIVSACSWIDNSWSMAMKKSDKAGEMLAKSLMEGVHGDRPVSLCGFGFGARVMFRCLEALARHGEIGIVQDAFLMGAPVGAVVRDWANVRSVVAGRLVNVHSPKDWLLAVCYRVSAMNYGCAGLQPVHAQGVENFDASDHIWKHTEYPKKAPELLMQLDPCYGGQSHVNSW